MEAKEMFKQHYGQAHPMTPNSKKYFKRGELGIEMSDGTNMNQPVTSITVLEEKNSRIIYRKDLSGIFSGRKPAEDYIETL